MIYEIDHRQMIDALDQDVVRRMRNWVDWKGGGSTSCSSSWVLDYGVGIHSGYREASMPVFVAEAQLTDRCIKAVPPDLGSAVALFWLAEGMSFVEMSAQLGCTDKTVKARVGKGHVEVTAEIYRQQSGVMLDANKARAGRAAPRDRPTSGPVTLLTARDSEV